ncbi:MAG: hypothetical protein QM713_00210 [Arachnia sp.]
MDVLKRLREDMEMRQADVRVGVEYALAEGSYSDVAARIRTTAPAKNAQVEADLLEMPAGPKGRGVTGLKVKPGGKTCVASTRHIFGTWEDWLIELARREPDRARREEERACRDEEIKELVNPDPQRVVPPSYELQPWFGEDVRWDNSSREASLRLGEAVDPYRGQLRAMSRPELLMEAAVLFKDLPPGLCRDVVAALEGPRDHQSWTASRETRVPAGVMVSVALARTAGLLNSLRYHQLGAISPDGFFDDADVAFIEAVVVDIESRGGQLLLPFVPPLPASSRRSYRYSDRSERACEVLGWIRLELAETGGVKLHAVSCHHVARPKPGEQLGTWPWWQVRLSPVWGACATCGGPGFASPVEVAHFVAASDVWAARGGGEIEAWQRLAVVRLMNVTAEDAARKGEGQPSLDALVAAALMEALPGEAGGDAYRLFLSTPYGFEPHGLDKTAEAQAITLARERLEVVRANLPASLAQVELPHDLTLQQVRRCHEDLSALVLERCLDKFLFALEDWD